MGTGLVEVHLVSWAGKSGKDYTYRLDGDYADGQGAYVFAKYQEREQDPAHRGSRSLSDCCSTLASLRDSLTGGGFRATFGWECSRKLGATHIFTHVNEEARLREVTDLDGEHRPPCNRW